MLRTRVTNTSNGFNMATDVIMPALGVAQEKGTLLHWLKTEGQVVTKGEPLMEIETDKATVEIEAPASGILSNVTAAVGDEVPVGNRIAVILAPGEVASRAAAQYPHARSSPHPSPLPEGEGINERRRPLPKGKRISEGRPVPEGTPVSAGHPLPVGEGRGEGRSAVRGKILASPAAKRIAREKGVDLATLRGSGPDEAVLAEDVLRSARAGFPAVAGGPQIKETVKLTAMRRIVGERMTKSKQTAPHFYLSIDADMTGVTRQRNALKAKGEEEIPSVNDFILYATARALREVPSLNAAFTDQGVQLYSDINIGVAVALDDGLVVPVIRNADRLSLQELGKQSRDLAEKAQKKKLLPSDYEGGTFTISNLGMFGVDGFIAIINPPQCAILAVGQVAPRVVAAGDNMVIRHMMTATLSADHRVVDGALAARFLQDLRRHLEKGEF
ncbi:MAG TPA: dihydrolipoamide acetyltransferase family protein [Candidatus Binatia bacterium]|nr:dihydrolipoamide acetyltransferase family protein [Candidatus Binatia bacterium]